MSREQVDLKLSRTIESYQSNNEEHPELTSQSNNDLDEGNDFPLLPLKNKTHRKYAVIFLYVVIALLVTGYFIPRKYHNNELEQVPVPQSSVSSIPTSTDHPPEPIPPASTVKKTDSESTDFEGGNSLRSWQLAMPHGDGVFAASSTDQVLKRSQLGENLPYEYKLYTVIFSKHPLFTEFLNEYDETLRPAIEESCFNDGSFEVSIDPDAVKHDMNYFEAYTVVSMDCRDSKGNPLISYLAVLSLLGEIQNVLGLRKRAESFSVKGSDTIIYTTFGEGGSFVWNWKKNLRTKLAFDTAHNIVYSETLGIYYGGQCRDGSPCPEPTSVAGYSFDGGKVYEYSPSLIDGDFITNISIEGDHLYISLSSNIFQKVNMRSQTVELSFNSLGAISEQSSLRSSPDSTFTPKVLDFHCLSEGIFAGVKMVSPGESEFFILDMKGFQEQAFQVFKFEMGDICSFDAKLDLLPSGNVFAISSPHIVSPSLPDKKYVTNFWEITPKGEIAWRLGIRASNLFDKKDGSTFPRTSLKNDLNAVGWTVSWAARLYSSPVTTNFCRMETLGGNPTIKFLAFNSALTNDNLPGVAMLYETEQNSVLGKIVFEFNRGWLPVSVEFEVPSAYLDSNLQIVVGNTWKDTSVLSIGHVANIHSCESFSKLREHRIFK